MSSKFCKKHFVRQLDNRQCGIASLAMICHYLGINVSTSYLSKLCDRSKEGISLKGISDVASQIGLKNRAYHLSIEELHKCPLPCIIHWSKSHFVVLYKISKSENYYIADPGKGMIKYKKADFISKWIDEGINDSGIAIFFEKERVIIPPHIVSVPKEPFSYILKYIKPYYKHLCIIGFGLILCSVLQLVIPFLTQYIVDIGIKHKDIGFIFLILLGELAIVIGKTSVDFIRRWLSLHISMRINISIVSDFFIKLLKLPMAFFEERQLGDIIQRIGDHTRIQSFLSGQILGLIFSTFTFCILSIVLFLYNKIIFTAFMTGSIIYGIWILIFLKKREILDYDIFEKESLNNERTYQLITLMQEIKLQNCENRRRWEWEDNQADLFETRLKSLKLQQTEEGGSIFINEIKNIIVTVLAASSVINGDLTIGAMLAIQYIIGQLNSPVEQFINFVHSIQDIKISFDRINDIHNQDNDDITEDYTGNINELGNITFEKVSFKYNRHCDKYAINNISFTLPKGKVTAIVGASGSGKTTIIKLILGFYKSFTGNLKIGETNLLSYNLKWWRAQCGVVMQSGYIFSDTIAKNIATQDEEINHERLLAAAKSACIYDFIETLPKNFNTVIGNEGIKLSQGQQQRILIARAIYKNPRYLILDEATNSLDAENENLIVNNLKEFYSGRTTIIVAHRLSTVMNADNIIVLDNGRIVENGTHTALVKQKGKYYNLVKNQLELECPA